MPFYVWILEVQTEIILCIRYIFYNKIYCVIRVSVPGCVRYSTPSEKCCDVTLATRDRPCEAIARLHKSCQAITS